jgi:hypothetical protein
MKRTSGFNLKTLFWQMATLLGLVILFTSPLTSALQALTMKHGVEISSAVTTASAADIYPLFTCPCCGRSLKKEKPCCGAMTQMIDFIDQRVNTGASKDAVILATTQEFGLERLANESDRLALKDQLLAQSPSDAPRIVIPETKRDLGTVSQSQGMVTTEFMLKNEGQSDLVIDKLSSSCGCTSGSLVYQDQVGPRFYMAGHGYEEPDASWQVAIAPGDEAIVKVYYDPTVHTDLTGPVTRTVSIHSNDPVDFETKITITLEQTR